jgi:hypothetical protein
MVAYYGSALTITINVMVMVAPVGDTFSRVTIKYWVIPLWELLIYERENTPCFSLELSHIQFINYSLHIVDLFHISCHDISIVITFLLTRKNTQLHQYYVYCLVVDYCMCLQTPDRILTSVTIIRHLQVCTLVTTIRGQCFENPTDYSSIQRYLVANSCSLTGLQSMRRE